MLIFGSLVLRGQDIMPLHLPDNRQTVDHILPARRCHRPGFHDLLILISFSGDTPYVLDNIKVAQKSGVPILALTNYLHSPLAESACCVLPTTADEQRLRLGAMDSTVAQFLVIDLLSSLMAVESPLQTEQRILQIFETTR